MNVHRPLFFVVFVSNARLIAIFADLKTEDYVRDIGDKLACESGAFQHRSLFGKVVLAAFHFGIHSRMVHFQRILQKGRRSGNIAGSASLYTSYRYHRRCTSRTLPLLPAGLLSRQLARFLGDFHAVERRPRQPWRNNCPLYRNVVVCKALRQEI